MRQIRVGDRVRTFLDANISGEVIEIFLRPNEALAFMVGGVPPMDAFAHIRLQNGSVATVKTTELSLLDP